MTRKHILVTVFAKAAWGGLHENVLAEVKALAREGFRVTVACSESRLAVRLRFAGASVITVDWSDPEASLRSVLSGGNYDLIHAHPFLSRVLALEVSKVQSCPVVVTIHGNYLDYANSWINDVDHVICVSEALRDSFLSNVSESRGDRVTVIANGVEDEVFERPVSTLSSKRGLGAVKILVASRLDNDKDPLIHATELTVQSVSRVFPSREISVRVLGDGTTSQESRSRIELAGARVDFLGWRMSESIVDYLSESVLAVCPGRAAAQSIAVGTPVIAAGSQGIAGLQVGRNLVSGWWANFGGYPVPQKNGEPALEELLLSESHYAKAQWEGRGYLRARAKQSVSDAAIVSLFKNIS